MASDAGAAPTLLVFPGTCDASAAVALDENRIIVAVDESRSTGSTPRSGQPPCRRVLLISDDGTRKLPGGDCKAAVAAQKSFRAVIRTLD